MLWISISIISVIYNSNNEQEVIQKLIKRASTPVPKEQDKQLHPDGYSKPAVK